MMTIGEIRSYLWDRVEAITARHGSTAARVIALWELGELEKDNIVSIQDAELLRGEIEDIPLF